MKFKNYIWEENKKYRYLLLISISVLLIISIFEAIKNNNYFLLGNLQKLNNDDVRYINTAKILIAKHELYYYGVKTAFIMPLYPLFLSLILSVFGTGNDGLTAVRVIQCLLQGVTLYFIYFIAKELFNRKVAIITSFLFVLYLPEIVAPNMILTEVLFQFLIITMFYFSIISIKENKIKYYSITAFLWTLACLTRPNAAVFPVFIIIYWIVNKYSWKEMLKYTILTFLIFITIFTPWWVRNYNLTGKFILFTNSSANPKLLGALIFNEPPSFAKNIPTKYGMIKFEKNMYLPNNQQNQLANYIIKTGFKTEPLRYFTWYTIGKTIMLYILPYYWKSILGINYIIMLLLQFIYLILSVLGIISIIKERKNRMLIVMFAITTIVYWPFFAFSRYGFPNMFMIIIFAAYKISNIIKNHIKE